MSAGHTEDREASDVVAEPGGWGAAVAGKKK